MTTMDSLLLFQVGPVPCCVVSDSVQIIIDPPAHITAIPGSNSFRLGLIVHAKKVVSVYDVRTKFNLSTEQRGKIIIAEIANRFFGFWVDSIQSVMLSSEGKFQILPAECPKELFESLFILNDQLILKTSFDAIAKAQVNTQIQQFFDKLTNDKEKKDKTKPSNIQNTTPKAESNSTPQTSKLSAEPANKPSAIKSSIQKKALNTIKQTPVKKPFSKTKITNNKISHLTSNQISKNKVSIVVRQPPAKGRKLKLQSQTSNNSIKEKTASKARTATHSHQFRKENIPSPSKTSLETRTFNSNKSNMVFDNSTTQAKTDENQDQQISLISIFIVLFMIITPISAWLFLTDSNTSERLEKRETLQYNTEVEAPLEDVSEYIPVSEAEPESTPVFIPEMNNAKTALTLENNTSNNESDTSYTDTTLPIDDKDKLSDIVIDNETIVITLNDSEGEFNGEEISHHQKNQPNTPTAPTDKASSSLKQNTAIQQDKEELINISIEPIENQLTHNKNFTEPTEDTSRKIIHIIVKGDTLWHIAKRYIHNPYKYPQLAKLSKIKNPDLIYPGNRVIIIIKNKTKRP